MFSSFQLLMNIKNEMSWFWQTATISKLYQNLSTSSECITSNRISQKFLPDFAHTYILRERWIVNVVENIMTYIRNCLIWWCRVHACEKREGKARKRTSAEVICHQNIIILQDWPRFNYQFMSFMRFCCVHLNVASEILMRTVTIKSNFCHAYQKFVASCNCHLHIRHFGFVNKIQELPILIVYI